MTRQELVQSVRLVAVLGAAVGVVLALEPFEVAGDVGRFSHAGAFYAYTLLALAALPWNRKGDVVFAVVCICGVSEVARELFGPGSGASLTNFVSDALGVGLAAAPVWVARLRELARRRSRAPVRGSSRRPQMKQLQAWVVEPGASHGQA